MIAAFKRKEGERFYILTGSGVAECEVSQISRAKVVVTVEYPPGVHVMREELYDKIRDSGYNVAIASRLIYPSDNWSVNLGRFVSTMWECVSGGLIKSIEDANKEIDEAEDAIMKKSTFGPDIDDTKSVREIVKAVLSRLRDECEECLS